MALPPTKTREIIFQLLYGRDTSHTDEHNSIALLVKELKISKSAIYHAINQATAVQTHLKEIDEAITKAVQGYSFDRIQNVERSILRLAVFEIIIEKNVPPKVAITEAMRLARKFSTPESANFINAVLDAIYKTWLGTPHTNEALETSIQALQEHEHLVKNAIPESN